MSNFDKFLKELKKESQECLGEINTKIKNTGKTIYESLMGPKSEQGTPKITGHLRSNWIVTIDQKYGGYVGSRENVDTSVRDYNYNDFLNREDLYLKENIYFNNNVFYGPIVNYDYGQGFREAAKDRGSNYIKANR